MFYVRFPSLLLTLLVLSALFWANTRMQYPQDGLTVSRSLDSRPLQSVSSITGVVQTSAQSVITLTITNPGLIERRNIVLNEDFSYLPSYIRLSFSVQPASNDGRTARWTLPVLAPGQSARFAITLPVAVSDGALARAPAPHVTSERPPAQLLVPALSDAGQNVAVQLRALDGTPLAHAVISVSSPDGRSVSLLTDSEGRAFYLAQASGFYSYSIPDFAVSFAPSTQVRAPALVLPPTTGAIVALPAANASAASAPAFNFDLSGLWLAAGGLMLAGFLAFGLYAYFNRSQPDDYMPTPPAPATRSMQDMRGFGSAPSDSGPVAARAGSGEEEPSPARPPGLPSPFSSLSGQPSPSCANSSVPSSSVRPSPDEPSPASSSALSNSPAIRTQTRELIRARREGTLPPAPHFPVSFGETTTPSPAAGSGVIPSSLSGPSSAPPASKPAYSEQTLVPPSRSEPDEEDVDSQGESEPARPPPAWMTRASSIPAESVEVDDEAIAKTISELEALREELRARSDKRREPTRSESDSSSDAHSSSAGSSSDEPDSSGHSDSEDSSSGRPPRDGGSEPSSSDEDSDSEFSSPVAALLTPKPSQSSESTSVSSAPEPSDLTPDEQAEMEAILSAQPDSLSETGPGPQSGEESSNGENASAPSGSDEGPSPAESEFPASPDEESADDSPPPAPEHPPVSKKTQDRFSKPSVPAPPAQRASLPRLKSRSAPAPKSGPPAKSSPSAKPSARPHSSVPQPSSVKSSLSAHRGGTASPPSSAKPSPASKPSRVRVVESAPIHPLAARGPRPAKAAPYAVVRSAPIAQRVQRGPLKPAAEAEIRRAPARPKKSESRPASKPSRSSKKGGRAD